VTGIPDARSEIIMRRLRGRVADGVRARPRGDHRGARGAPRL